MKIEPPHTGGCLCGAIRYEATAQPLRGVVCHCAMCRRHSGAPALAFVHFPRAFYEAHGFLPGEKRFVRRYGSS